MIIFNMNNKLVHFFVVNWLKGLVFVVIGTAIIFLIQFNNTENQQTYVVSEYTVEQVVLLSGSVKAVGQVDLSFDSSGKVASTSVSQGDLVTAGQVLAELDYGVLKADLLRAQGKVQSAQSNVTMARAAVQKAKANLALVQAQNRGTDSSLISTETFLANTMSEQATLVKNAYLDLLNNDLTAYPVDSRKNIPAPVVSGSFNGESTGQYVLEFYNSGSRTGYSTRVSGFFKDTISFDDFGIPSSLGEHGLYLTLPESGETKPYGSTDWVIPIPNTRSTTYQTKLGVYKKALQSETVAIAKAQSNLDTLRAQQESGISIAATTAQEQQSVAALQEAEANLSQVSGSLTQAEAEVAKVQAQIENNIIKAPFYGTIARLNFEVGQTVTPANTGITLVTADDYELTVSIPEIDVAKVKIGDAAEVILDAYGTEIAWAGVLTEIELIETEVDGVPSYSSVITLIEPDERIKIGMNARARIMIQEKKDVLAVPSAYVMTNDGVSTVLFKQNEKRVVERVVSTGLRGTDFFIEITDGLSDGDVIIMPAGE